MNRYDRPFRPPFRGARGAYDRGVYGGDYPGPAVEGWDAPRYGPRDLRPPRGRSYDGDFARAPFLPEEAYRRHPEYDRGPGHRHPGFDWDAPPDPRTADARLRHEVCMRLDRDGSVDPRRVAVEVRGGVVRLSGEVDDFLAARHAWDDAWETPGVRGVLNHLTVRTDRSMGAHGDILPQSTAEIPDARRESRGW